MSTFDDNFCAIRCLFRGGARPLAHEHESGGRLVSCSYYVGSRSGLSNTILELTSSLHDQFERNSTDTMLTWLNLSCQILAAGTVVTIPPSARHDASLGSASMLRQG